MIKKTVDLIAGALMGTLCGVGVTAVCLGAKAINPTGTTANNRVAGYMEVLKTIHESAMSEDCKRAAEFAIMNSTPIAQYFVEPAGIE